MKTPTCLFQLTVFPEVFRTLTIRYFARETAGILNT